jgi:VWFA-related protein
MPMPTPRRTLLLVASIILGTAIATGAVPQVFRSGAQTVAIYATVIDRDNRLVTDLEEQHFQVFDNMKPQPLTVFKSDIQAITVVVMLDTSGSMTLNLDRLKRASEQFVLRLLPQDRARIGSFAQLIKIDPPTFTSDRDVLTRILHTEIRFGNPTFLWDAIDRSMDALVNEEGRRVVLIFTDGEDERSVKTNFDQVVERAQREDFMIYAIGLQSSIPALNRITRPDRNLRKLAEVTGGGYFELRERDDLNATFTKVADELHRQYVLGFNASVLDGLMHKLDVQVKVPGMTVRARKSYLAKGGGSSTSPSSGTSPSR